MEKSKKAYSTTGLQKGIPHPTDINPDILRDRAGVKRKIYSVDDYVDGIISGNRTILSQTITLVESSLPEHSETALKIVEKCLPFSGNSIRIGITGVPGAGKSTFIETFGLHLTENGRRPAILTIDPSSEFNKGSILGDKTRMEKLGTHPDAYIRPSPSVGTSGGVARTTRETIILCEAAGFDTIIVETLGVGQSETLVRSMVDCFLLLMLTGSGDELQGIKRGIIEMADLIAVTKADGLNKHLAEYARSSIQNALKHFPIKPSGWKPRVLTCSAIENSGIKELWTIMLEYFEFAAESGYHDELRRQQDITRMDRIIREHLYDSFYNQEDIKLLKTELERKLNDGQITSYRAALSLLDKYFKR